MKLYSLFRIVCASVRGAIVKSASFFLFIALASALLLSVVAVMAPLWYNMEYKVNNHVYNRELTATFTSSDAVEEGLKQLEDLEHVTGTYHKPVPMSVRETSGLLYSDYEMDYLHKGYTPVITAGRSFKSGEKNVALVPEKIQDFQQQNQKRNEVSGKSLLGEELILEDSFGLSHRLRVIGVYNTANPIFNGRQILIPIDELLHYNGRANEITENQAFSLKETLRYGVCVDSYKNVEAVQEEAMAVTATYQEDQLNFDIDTFNTALAVLLAIAVMFIVMVIAGVWLFVLSCLKSRTEELALYRALGYRTKHLYGILFAEYGVINLCSILLGTGLAALFNALVVNPYLDELVGNTIMEMHAQVHFASFAATLLVFTLIVGLVCLHAAKKSNQIELIVLLRASG